MNLVDLFLLLMGCAGVTWTMVQSTIVDKIGLRPLWEKHSKFLTELFRCEFCTGWHVGYSYGLMCYWLASIQSIWFYVLTIPFASSFISFIYGKTMSLLIELNELAEKRNKKE